MSFSLAELSDLVGAKRRTLQLWAEGGVLEAEPGTLRSGKGVHRRFAREEVIVACLVYAFSRRLQSPIGVLIDLASMLRRTLENEGTAAKIESAIDDPDSRLIIAVRGSGVGDVDDPDVSSIVLADPQTGNAKGIVMHLTQFVFQRGGFSILIAVAPQLSGLRSLKTG